MVIGLAILVARQSKLETGFVSKLFFGVPPCTIRPVYVFETFLKLSAPPRNQR